MPYDKSKPYSCPCCGYWNEDMKYDYYKKKEPRNEAGMSIEDEADRYGKICEAQRQLKDLIKQFDTSGMFIVASELRTVEKRVGDVVKNLGDIFGMGA